MDNAAHTPGPWRADGCEIIGDLLVALEECASRCRYDGDLFHDQGLESRRDASWAAAELATAAIAKAKGTTTRATILRALKAHGDMLAALKTCRCPGGGWNGMPADIEPTIENCMAAGACGCDCGDAIRKVTGGSQ